MHLFDKDLLNMQSKKPIQKLKENYAQTYYREGDYHIEPISFEFIRPGR